MTENIRKPQFVQGAIQALSGTQFRAGLGLYALEDAVGNIIEQGFTGEAAGEIATRATANIVATYSIPFTAGQDLYNTFAAPDDISACSSPIASPLGRMPTPPRPARRARCRR